MGDFDIKQVLGTALAGAAGFAIGFYAGFFMILSIWGLEFSGVGFAVITGGLGALVAGGAMSWTVREGRKLQPFLLAVVFGVALVILTANADAGALAVGGLVMVVGISVVVRTGFGDRLVGG